MVPAQNPKYGRMPPRVLDGIVVLLAFAYVLLQSVCLAAGTDSASESGPDLPAAPARLWFSNCEFEMNRYISCRVAPRAVEDWLKARSGVHPGMALTEYLKAYFEARGCRYGVVKEAFRINGVFFSFDTQEMQNIDCNASASSALRFRPDGLRALDRIDFWFEDRPPDDETSK